MSDTALNKIIQYGTNAARIAYTPNPASGSKVLYIWYTTDTTTAYVWNGSAWVSISGGGGGGGGLVFLESHIASGSASLDFTSISSTYDTYLFELVEILPATNGVELIAQFSTDGGSTYDTGANYYENQARWGTGGLDTGGNSGNTQIDLTKTGGNDLSNDATEQGLSGEMRLFNPLGTTGYKHITGQTVYWHTSGQPVGIMNASMYKSASAVNAVRFMMTSGNIATGVIRMYGLAKS